MFLKKKLIVHFPLRKMSSKIILFGTNEHQKEFFSKGDSNEHSLVQNIPFAFGCAERHTLLRHRLPADRPARMIHPRMFVCVEYCSTYDKAYGSYFTPTAKCANSCFYGALECKLRMGFPTICRCGKTYHPQAPPGCTGIWTLESWFSQLRGHPELFGVCSIEKISV